MSTFHRDDLELLERLGGSGAEIHRAVLRDSGAVVVTKHVGWDRPTVAERLGREAALLQRHRHPSLVRLLARLDDEDGRCLVLAHAPGGSLADAITRHGALPAPRVTELGARLAEALAVLHAGGVTHRDVHPGNIVLDAELQPVLIDLDRALSMVDTPLPGDTDTVGHPDHTAGRVLAGAPADMAGDLHALATTLWTCATGGPPPRTPAGDVELPRHPGVPRALHALLAACVRGDAGDAAAVARGLDRLAMSTGQPVPFPARSPGQSPATGDHPAVALRAAVRRRVARPPRRLAVAVGSALLTVLAAGWALQATGTEDGLPTSVPAVAPPPCTPLAAPVAAGDDATLLDLDGDGCSELATLDDGVLRLPGGEYAVGLAGDQLLVGDWDGDDRWGIGLYRPTTGEVFLIDDPGPGATSRPVRRLAPDGIAVVVDTGTGHDVRVDLP